MLNSENLQKIIRFGVYLALLTPLVYIPQTLFGAIFGKMIYFQIITELTFPFFLYLIIFYKGFRPKISGLTKLILLFFTVLFLSSLLGIDWHKSFWGDDERMRGLFGLLHFLAFYFYIITVFKTSDDRRKLILFVIAVGILVAVFGVAERINPALSIDKVSDKVASGHRVMSTAGNSIFLAGYLIFVCFLSLHYYLRYKGYGKWIGLGGFFLSALVIFFTGTRGAFLGFLGGLAAMLVLLFFNTTKKKKIIIAISASAFAILLLLVFVADIKVLMKNRYWNFSRLTDISLNNAGGARLLLWQSALKAFKERPVFGWGAENFDYAFDKYYNPQFYRGGINETWSNRAHNWFLDFLVMGGAPGLAAYLAIFVYLGIALAKKDNRKKANFAFSALFSAFLIHSFFAVDDPSTNLMLFAALAVCFLVFEEGKRIANPEGEQAPYGAGYELRITNRYGVFSFLCLFIFSLLLIYFYNLRPLYAGIDFISFRREQIPEQKKILAEKFLSSGSPYSDYFRFRFATEAFLDAGEINDKDYAAWALDRAIGEMTIVLRRHSGDYSYFHTLGNIYLRKGVLFKDMESLDKAIEIYKRALEISPRRQATIFQLSTTYLFRDKSSEAVKTLKGLVVLDDKIGQSYWRLAVALLADGKKEEAYNAFKDAMKRGFFDMIDIEQKQAIALCVQFKDYNCAAQAYEILIERSPQNADLYAQLAAAYAAAGKYEDAKRAVIRAVELDPSLEAEAKTFLKNLE